MAAVSRSAQADVLKINPLQLGLVNRLAPGTVAKGAQAFQGGLLLQGQWQGSGMVGGNLVITQKGLLVGHFRVTGDLYVFGQLGHKNPGLDETLIECHGTTFMAYSAVSYATLLTVGLRLYEGAKINGEMRTLKTSS